MKLNWRVLVGYFLAAAGTALLVAGVFVAYKSALGSPVPEWLLEPISSLADENHGWLGTVVLLAPGLLLLWIGIKFAREEGAD